MITKALIKRLSRGVRFNTRGVPWGEMFWEFVPAGVKRARRALIKARRRQSRLQRRGVRV